MLNIIKLIFFHLLIVTSVNAEIDNFPVVSANMAGEGYKILIGGEIKKIKINFKNEVDQNSFFNIKPEILFNSVNAVNKAPKLFLVGKITNDGDFLAESWFLLSPYYEVNSLVEGEYDAKKTKQKTTLTALDFNTIWDINKSHNGKFITPQKRPNNINWIKYLKKIEPQSKLPLKLE